MYNLLLLVFNHKFKFQDFACSGCHELAMLCLNPLTTNFPHYIQTSELIYITYQLTGFYMMGNIGRQWVNIRDIAILTVRRVDCRCILYDILYGKSEAIHLLENYVLINDGYIYENPYQKNQY